MDKTLSVHRLAIVRHCLSYVRISNASAKLCRSSMRWAKLFLNAAINPWLDSYLHIQLRISGVGIEMLIGLFLS